jgi:hypothetical protein
MELPVELPVMLPLPEVPPGVAVSAHAALTGGRPGLSQCDGRNGQHQRTERE